MAGDLREMNAVLQPGRQTPRRRDEERVTDRRQPVLMTDLAGDHDHERPHNQGDQELPGKGGGLARIDHPRGRLRIGHGVPPLVLALVSAFAGPVRSARDCGAVQAGPALGG